MLLIHMYKCAHIYTYACIYINEKRGHKCESQLGLWKDLEGKRKGEMMGL